MGWLMALIAVLVVMAPAEAQQRCTKTWNAAWRQWDVYCDDGSAGTERYNRTPWGPAQIETETTTPGVPFDGLKPDLRLQSPTRAPRWNQSSD